MSVEEAREASEAEREPREACEPVDDESDAREASDADRDDREHDARDRLPVRRLISEFDDGGAIVTCVLSRAAKPPLSASSTLLGVRT